MSRHDDRVYLQHMLDHARTCMELSSGYSRKSLDDNRMLRYALLHLLCILGEAANRVSAEGRKQYSLFPWRDVIGMRNALIHGYDNVDLDILWKTVEVDLPAVVEPLTKGLGNR